MLFEPSGELHCDYGAYCHALGLTEREELYRSIFTNEEERREKEAKYLTNHSPLITNQSVGSGIIDSPLQQVIAAAAGVSLPFPAATNTTTAAAAPPPTTTATTTPPKRSASTASGRNRKKEVALEDSSKSMPQTVPPAITFIVMRNLKFCLNERDMKPLALAIPHCHSLVSVEFVGCGLSMESYFLLVESLYKSRRVASVTIDFNSIHYPGFFEDPTIPVTTHSGTLSGTLEGKTALDLSFGTTVEETTNISPEISAALSGDVRKSIVQIKDSGTRISDDSMSLKLRKSAMLGGVKFAPSAYRGLNGVLSALEYQVRDEKDRKGKVDSKKQAQHQQQQDQIAQIDKESPIFVPRGWPSMVLTGVKHLSLRGNGITDDDVIIMASLLARHPRSELISLNLWGNRITDSGANALASMLKENRTLQVLDLGHNNIGDVGLLQLVDCFRMQDIPMEKLISYRKRHLMRRDATLREQQLASTAPPAYPSYQELYNAWYQNKFPAVAEEKKDSKKASQAKAKKTEAVLVRPTSPFDRDCFRMENSVRVPGNTVLRCVNLGNNQNITVGGAREALRILALREPSDDGEMSALQNSSTHPPELYCASITLRSFVILHSGDSELREVQKTLSDVLHERQLLLPQPAPEDEVVVEDAKKKSPRNKK